MRLGKSWHIKPATADLFVAIENIDHFVIGEAPDENAFVPQPTGNRVIGTIEFVRSCLVEKGFQTIEGLPVIPDIPVEFWWKAD